MNDVLTYFFFNALGFVFFLFIWNRMPKVRFDRLWRQYVTVPYRRARERVETWVQTGVDPGWGDDPNSPKPFDFTTIPGLKLEVATAEEIPPLSLASGTRLSTISATEGNLSEIKRFPHHRQFLEYLRLCFGDLNSFYWGPRYVVTIASEKLVNELSIHQRNMAFACPLAFASILNCDSNYWGLAFNDAVKIDGPSKKKTLDPMLLERNQNKLFLAGPQPNERSTVTTKEAVKQVPLSFREDICSPKSIREILSRPLTVIFNTQIELDAHPIPKHVPVIIHVGGLIQNWSTEEIWEKYYDILSWIPGIDLMKTLERDIEAKIRRETTRRERE